MSFLKSKMTECIGGHPDPNTFRPILANLQLSNIFGIFTSVDVTFVI